MAPARLIFSAAKWKYWADFPVSHFARPTFFLYSALKFERCSTAFLTRSNSPMRQPIRAVTNLFLKTNACARERLRATPGEKRNAIPRLASRNWRNPSPEMATSPVGRNARNAIQSARCAVSSEDIENALGRSRRLPNFFGVCSRPLTQDRKKGDLPLWQNAQKQKGAAFRTHPVCVFNLDLLLWIERGG